MPPERDDNVVIRLRTAVSEGGIEQLSERELNKRMRSLVSIRIALED